MTHDIPIGGTCPNELEPIREAFRTNFSELDDVGASFALYRDGELLVDLWGGWLDAERSTPWQKDTIVNVYSTTKTMTALCALVLADRGEIEFDRPVAEYWPEFAQNGKEGVLVSHLMSHTAGLSGLEEPFPKGGLYDWDLVVGKLAAQAPWWEPGAESGYHAITQGFLIGEVVRRVTGRSLGAFFREEIAQPLDADFHIGLPESETDRVGLLIPPPPAPLDAGLDPESVAARTFRCPALAPEDSWTREWQASEIPAAGGHGNARSVATVQAVLANGGELNGNRILSEAGCLKALEEQTNGMDLVLGVPLRHGLGYGLQSDAIPIGPSTNVLFWGGWGGSTVVVDLDERLAFSYVMNRMEAGTLGDLRGAALTLSVYQAFGKL